MSTRDSFVKHFGEGQAQRIEAAADEHANGVNDQQRGSDPFRWAISIVIGYECAVWDSYRKHHGITAPWDAIKQWIKDHGDLANHDGDCDYLALMAGAYNEFVGVSEPQS